jgi:hypothetical protein
MAESVSCASSTSVSEGRTPVALEGLSERLRTAGRCETTGTCVRSRDEYESSADGLLVRLYWEVCMASSSAWMMGRAPVGLEGRSERRRWTMFAVGCKPDGSSGDASDGAAFSEGGFSSAIADIYVKVWGVIGEQIRAYRKKKL